MNTNINTKNQQWEAAKEPDKVLAKHYQKLYQAQREEERAQLVTIRDLKQQIGQLQLEKTEIQKVADHYEASPLWKSAKPARFVWKKIKRVKNILKKYGFVGSIHRTGQKIKEKETNQGEFNRIILKPETEKKQRETIFPLNIKFSILVPLYNTPIQFLKEMMDSCFQQTYRNWELCLADGSDEAHREVMEYCQREAEKDSRIRYQKLEKNGGISENTNVCFQMAAGDYIALFDHDDILHPSVLYECMRAICEEDADYIYTDEATFEGYDIRNIITYHFKPDFAIDNLRANNYICHFSAFKAALLKETGLFRKEYDGSQDHDMILRLTSAAKKVYHIPKLLYYWRSHAASVAQDINSKTYAIDAGKRAVKDHLLHIGIQAEVESSKAFPTIFKIRYELTIHPMVSILIPNKDHVADLTKCIDSILEKSTYRNFEIIVIENNSEQSDTFAYYSYLESLENVSVIRWEGDFNYAAINNYGAAFAKGEYLLLLNNDTEVINEDWLEELLMYGQRKDVGAVGAKLYYPDDTIQHAGVVIGLGAHRAAGHSHYGVSKENLGYMGRLFYAQDVSAVTGACLLVRKELFDSLDGLDERFTVAFNDVDFCLRIRERGLLVVFNPYAELYHYESKSRGFENTEEKRTRFESEVKMFQERYQELLEKGDPYYNPNFSLDSADFTVSLQDWS